MKQKTYSFINACNKLFAFSEFITLFFANGSVLKANQYQMPEGNILIQERDNFDFGNLDPFIWPEYSETGDYPENMTPSFDAETGVLITGLYGFAGWRVNESIDLSLYEKLVVKLKEPPFFGAQIRFFD